MELLDVGRPCSRKRWLQNRIFTQVCVDLLISGATFINLHMSTLSQKWFGESERLVDAVFSLAHKLQPAIIFIDEIDSFLRERNATDHEVISIRVIDAE